MTKRVGQRLTEGVRIHGCFLLDATPALVRTMNRLPHLLSAALLLALTWTATAATVPAGFSETTLASGITGSITGMDWAPDGSNRLFVTVKNGPIRIVKNGALLATPFYTFLPFTNSECGVLSLCFDPDFLTSRRLYVFYTVDNRIQRIVSLVDSDSNDIADGAPVTVVDDLPTLGLNHDGGGLGIGADNKLYFAVGDLGDARVGMNADLTSMASKVGRANLDGSVPVDNPFVDGAGPNNDFIWARGFRNPFSLTFQPSTGALWVNVVGDNWEQIFRVAVGEHAGDRTRENAQTAPYIRPQIAYATNGGGSFGGCVTGGTFYGATALPSAYHGDYFFVDYNSGNIMRSELDGSNNVTSTVVWISGVSQAIDMVTGPDGALYYASLGGTIYRLINTAPTQDIVLSAISLRLNEGRSALYSVRLATAPTANVTVTMARTAGDADVAVSGGASLVFTPTTWATPQAVIVTAAEDSDLANDSATISASAGGFATRAVAVTATDNDTQVIVVSSTTATLTEGGTTTFTVRLQQAPTANVSVAVTRSAGDGDVSVSSGSSLTFTPLNYASAQTVTVAAAQDADIANDSATLSIATVGAATRTVAVTVSDDDAAAPVITSTADTTATINAAYAYDVNASGTPPPTFSLTTAPTGMTINATSGIIAWMPSVSGTSTVTVQASNGVGTNATQSYQLVVAADQPPTASITAPLGGQVLSGASAEFYGDGSDDVGITRAEFLVDSVLVSTDVGTGGHYHAGGSHNLFDTRPYANGSHVLRMVVYDTAGQSHFREVTVTITNTAPPPGTAAPVSGGDDSDGCGSGSGLALMLAAASAAFVGRNGRRRS